MTPDGPERSFVSRMRTGRNNGLPTHSQRGATPNDDDQEKDRVSHQGGGAQGMLGAGQWSAQTPYPQSGAADADVDGVMASTPKVTASRPTRALLPPAAPTRSRFVLH